jgi:hypothetical protein
MEASIYMAIWHMLVTTEKCSNQSSQSTYRTGPLPQPRVVRDNGNCNGRPPSLLKPSHNPISVLVFSMEVVYSKPQGDPHAGSGHLAWHSSMSILLASRQPRPFHLYLTRFFQCLLCYILLYSHNLALSAAQLYLTTSTRASNKEDPQRQIPQCDVLTT